MATRLPASIPFGVANPSLYSSNGCTLATAPTIISTAWTASRYTSCSTIDSYGAQVTSTTNVYGQTSTTSYDYTQGGLPVASTNPNQQTTTLSYGYSNSATATVQQSEPGEASGGYTNQSSEKSTCTSSSTTPCFEIDTNSSLYQGAVSQTFYDSEGRAVETRAPLDANDDLISYTLYDDEGQKYFKSVPFRYPHSVSGWVDPATATIDDDGQTGVDFTLYRYDPLGRVIAVKDPLYLDGYSTGVSCDWQSDTWSSCTEYTYLPAYNQSTLYQSVETVDGNNNITVTLSDTLGRTRYQQLYSTRGAAGSNPADSNVTQVQETQYNALNKPTAVIVTDEAPQSGQSITSVTTTATYDDMGRTPAGRSRSWYALVYL